MKLRKQNNSNSNLYFTRKRYWIDGFYNDRYSKKYYAEGTLIGYYEFNVILDKLNNVDKIFHI